MPFPALTKTRYFERKVKTETLKRLVGYDINVTSQNTVNTNQPNREYRRGYFLSLLYTDEDRSY